MNKEQKDRQLNEIRKTAWQKRKVQQRNRIIKNKKPDILELKYTFSKLNNSIESSKPDNPTEERISDLENKIPKINKSVEQKDKKRKKNEESL